MSPLGENALGDGTLGDGGLEQVAGPGIQVVNEWMQMSEASPRRRSLRRRVAEVVDLLEAAVRTRALRRRVSESESVQEATRRARSMIRRLAETVRAHDQVIRAVAGALVRVVFEAIQASDLSARARSMIRAAAESERIQEAAGRARAMWRSAADAVNVQEASQRLRGMARSVAEELDVQDAAAKWVFSLLVQAVSDMMELGDDLLSSMFMVRTAGESVGLQDAVDRAKMSLYVLSDLVMMMDSVQHVSMVVREVDEVVRIIEDYVTRRLGPLITWIIEIDEPVQVSEFIESVRLSLTDAWNRSKARVLYYVQHIKKLLRG